MADLIVPKLGESISEAVIAKWLKHVGEATWAAAPAVNGSAPTAASPPTRPAAAAEPAIAAAAPPAAAATADTTAGRTLSPSRRRAIREQDGEPQASMAPVATQASQAAPQIAPV